MLIKDKSSKKSASKFFPMLGKVTTVAFSRMDKQEPESPTPWLDTEQTK